MEWVIDFIRNFDLKNLITSGLDLVIFIGAILITSILFRWATSYLKTPLKERIRKVVSRISLIVVYGFVILIFLNKIVIEDYFGAFLLVFVAFLAYLRSVASYLVKKYDAFIDRLADKI